MSQSLYTAMSGIAAATTDLQVISDNIANINTTAYKSSSVEFSDVFSRTISSGSVATNSTGGTNPVQVGVGTQVSAVSKNFSTGSWVSTGKSTDLMIEGSGFFTVTDGTSTFYTRAGDFSFDAKGNLVTSEGYKVLGTNSIMSTTSSTSTVKVPLSICADVTGNPNLSTVDLSNLNNISNNITQGEFDVQIATAGGTETVKVNLSSADVSGTAGNLATAIETALNSTSEEGDDLTGITVTAATDGTMQFDLSKLKVNSITTAPTGVVFSTPTTSASGSISNFVTETDLANSTMDSTTKIAATKVLDETATISQLSSASAAISETAETINSDGSIQVTYSDGSVLSVELGADKSTYQFVYTTSDSVQISGTKCSVDANVATPSNFVIQLGTITNTEGLLSVGSNLYEAGPNSGNIVYTVGNEMGAGKLESGGLEASNVDLSSELSDMILAQRAVEANSRVFTATSDVMSTIVQMGR